MAKFLKSIFHTTERRKVPHYEHEAEEERSESPHRRQLSISRSGRMKQANKKRHSLTLELYGDSIQIDTVERPKSREYHVHNTPSNTAPADLGNSNTTEQRFENKTEMKDIHNLEDSIEVTNTFDVSLVTKLKTVSLDKSPEEEIDNAFEILDKT